MALTRLAHGLHDINGKRSGNIYRRDTSGTHASAFPRLVNRQPTADQTAQRVYFSRANTAWTGLAGTQYHLLWQIYSSMHPVTNKKGETKILTGRNQFFKVNMVRLGLGERMVSQPPF